MTEVLSEQEAALYDRQIRLWGLETQRRIRSARVLFISMSPVAQEIAKNFTLAGVGYLTLVDDHVTTEDDVKVSFLLDKTHLDKERGESCISNLQPLNPLVKMNAISLNGVHLADWTSNILNVDSFDMIVYCPDEYNENKYIMEILATKIRNSASQSTGYIEVHVVGHHSFCLVDLNDKFLCRTKNDNEQPVGDGADANLKVVKYPELSQILVANNISVVPKYSLPYFILDFALIQFLREYGKYPTQQDVNILTETCQTIAKKHELNNVAFKEEMIAKCCQDKIAPINAIVGGIMAQEIIKIISMGNKPYGNYFYFDPIRNDFVAHEIQLTFD